MRTVAFALIYLCVSSILQAQSATDLYQRGIDHFDKGEYDNAIADLDQALAINSNSCAAYFARACAWDKKGEYTKAIADFTEVARLDPKHADTRFNRGRMWEKKLDYDHAYADYSDALRLNPNDFHIHNNLAWLQATCPVEKYRDGKKALENANRACQLHGGEHWRLAGTLAAAYAESGEFEKAREWQGKAIKLVGDDKTATDTNNKAMQSRLELYKADKPYREPAKLP